MTFSRRPEDVLKTFVSAGIKNANTENITCDGSRAYLKTRTKKQYYCLLVKDDRVISKTVHSSNDEN